MFGSRNSLSQAKPDLDSDEDDDICGSRNSLSGLKRWTTEENLSFTDPRGSRSELMEVPLNDSHSNSTGKLYFAISRKKSTHFCKEQHFLHHHIQYNLDHLLHCFV